jgi:hypothetical protein
VHHVDDATFVSLHSISRLPSLLLISLLFLPTFTFFLLQKLNLAEVDQVTLFLLDHQDQPEVELVLRLTILLSSHFGYQAMCFLQMLSLWEISIVNTLEDPNHVQIQPLQLPPSFQMNGSKHG